MKRTALTAMLYGTISAMPLKVRKALFIIAAEVFYFSSSRQRLITLHNLSCAFPEMDKMAIIHRAHRVYRHFAVVAAEFFEIPAIRQIDPAVISGVEGLEHCREALNKNKGLLFLSAHFGNWEYGAALIARLVGPVTIIYRPFDSPILENLISWVRASTGNTPLPKERASLKIFRSLARNESIGILMDQNVAVREGIFVDFFGRPACTTDGIALLALNTEAPVIPTFMHREQDGRYHLTFGEEVEIIRTGDLRADIAANTQKFTKIIEDMIRTYPDQWLWLHQRWKTKPCQVE